MKGKLWGVGVGPGDWELMTLKGVRIIKEADVIAVPRTKDGNNAAFDIVKQAVNIEDKLVLYLDFLMTRNREELENSHRRIAQLVCAQLEKNQNVAFITLGDVSLYSTFSYIGKLVQQAGYETEICPGIPSFCAVGARLGISLTSMKKPVHIIPAAHVDVKRYKNLDGTKIFMKAGKRIRDVYETYSGADVWGIENCGMADERIISYPDRLEAGYFTTMIVKEKE